MVSGGPEMKESVIEGMRQPGERVPICLLRAAERPFDCVPGQPSADMLIAGHVGGVVEADKIVRTIRVVHAA